MIALADGLSAVGFGMVVPAGAQTPVNAQLITGMTTRSGPMAGGTVVTLTGHGFTQANQVLFGTAPVENYVVNSDTSITATSPAVPSDGTVYVTVTTPAGTSGPDPHSVFTYSG